MYFPLKTKAATKPNFQFDTPLLLYPMTIITKFPQIACRHANSKYHIPISLW